MVTGYASESILGKAQVKGLIEIRPSDIRAFAEGKHKVTDDAPYGGGAGMVMKPEPLFRAVEAVTSDSPEASVVLLSPQGRLFDQNMAREFSLRPKVVLICGRYEGVDQRVVEHLITDELSIGDFVLSGGEIPAMIILDAVTRVIPGALGCEQSAERESFVGGLLDFPQYTRPADYRGMKVPDVLLSGNHAEIEQWRWRKSIEQTLLRRPDLIEAHEVSPDQRLEMEKILQDIDQRRAE